MTMYRSARSPAFNPSFLVPFNFSAAFLAPFACAWAFWFPRAMVRREGKCEIKLKRENLEKLRARTSRSLPTPEASLQRPVQGRTTLCLCFASFVLLPALTLSPPLTDFPFTVRDDVVGDVSSGSGGSRSRD